MTDANAPRGPFCLVPREAREIVAEQRELSGGSAANVAMFTPLRPGCLRISANMRTDDGRTHNCVEGLLTCPYLPSFFPGRRHNLNILAPQPDHANRRANGTVTTGAPNHTKMWRSLETVRIEIPHDRQLVRGNTDGSGASDNKAEVARTSARNQSDSPRAHSPDSNDQSCPK